MTRSNALASLSLLGLAAMCVAQPQYTITEVKFGNEIIGARGLSDTGFVVGHKPISQWVSHGVRWRDGNAEWLPGFQPGQLGQGASSRSVNSAGIAAGHANNEPAGYSAAAMWDEAGNLHNLGHLGAPAAWASDINDANWIVGSSYISTSSGHYHPFLWRNGNMVDLGLVPNSQGYERSSASAVNESGTVVGSQRDSEGRWRIPWMWTEAGGMRRLFPDLPVGPGDAFDINDPGEVLLNSQPNDQPNTFVWSNGQVRQLGPGYGLAINNDGWVVGLRREGLVPSLWIGQARHTIENLLVPGTGYSITDVLDINNSGQILAVGYRGGVGNSLLLTPVPEPASLLGLAIGTALLAKRRRRR